MSALGEGQTVCLVDGCAAKSASNLGVCAGHWRALPQDLRDRWWQAWHDDGRITVWAAVRRTALDHLAGVAT